MPSLFDRLTALLTDTPLLWLNSGSDMDYPIEPVTLSSEQLTGAVVEGDGLALLCEKYADIFRNLPTGERKTFSEIIMLFRPGWLLALKRPNGKPSEFDLLILTADAGAWVGIKTLLVET